MLRFGGCCAGLTLWLWQLAEATAALLQSPPQRRYAGRHRPTAPPPAVLLLPVDGISTTGYLFMNPHELGLSAMGLLEQIIVVD